jgi:hypothetical protein
MSVTKTSFLPTLRVDQRDSKEAASALLAKLRNVLLLTRGLLTVFFIFLLSTAVFAEGGHENRILITDSN